MCHFLESGGHRKAEVLWIGILEDRGSSAHATRIADGLARPGLGGSLTGATMPPTAARCREGGFTGRRKVNKLLISALADTHAKKATAPWRPPGLRSFQEGVSVFKELTRDERRIPKPLEVLCTY